MKKYLLLLLLFLINFWGYSQTQTQATVTEIAVDGARTVTFTNPATITINNKITENNSNSSPPNGKISFSISGGNKISGDTPYTLTWENPLPNSATISIDANGNVILSNLPNGTYRATIKDATCTVGVSDSFVIYDKLNVSVVQSNIKCFGGNNGSITLTIKGGSGTNTIKWNNTTFTDSERTGLQAGSYMYTITDEKAIGGIENIENNKKNGMLVEGTITISAPNSSLNSTLSMEKQPSPGNNDGTLKLAVSGGYENYSSYSWKKDGQLMNPQPTRDILGMVFGLGDGTYQVSVIDKGVDTAEGCLVNSNEIILKALNVKIATPQPISCQGGTTNLTAAASGGEGTINYAWYKLISNSVVGNELSINNSLNNINAGSYKVVVTDSKDNETSATINIPESSNPTITAITTPTNVTCFDGSDGSASIAITNYDHNKTYSFKWYKKTEPLAELKSNITTVASSSTLSGLTKGAYEVKVTDGFCETPFDVTIGSASLIVVKEELGSFKNLKCYGDANGSIKISVDGGLEPYTIKWKKDNAPITVNNDLNPTNLGAGNYSVEVYSSYDANKLNNCSQGIKNIIISAPNELKFKSKKTEVSCKNSNDGTIQLNISGGTFQTDSNNKPIYTISCEPIVSSPKPLIDIPNQKITGLSAGIWRVSVFDDNNCSTVVQEIEIKEPNDQFSFSAAVITNVSGYALTNGSITAKNIGGWGNYFYQWYEGSTVDNSKLLSSETTNQIKDKPAGKYTLIVTDKNSDGVGCSLAPIPFEIKEPTILKLDVVANNTQCNAELGSIAAVATGGAEIAQQQNERIYTYELFHNNVSKQTIVGNTANFNGLEVGQYKVVAKDSKQNVSTDVNTKYGNGSIITIGYTELTEPKPIVIIEEKVIGVKKLLNCYGDNDGILSVAVSGGTAFTTGSPYTYIWKKYNSATTIYEPIGTNAPKQSNLLVGKYSVEVRDANYDPIKPSSCIAILDNLLIDEPKKLSFTTTPTPVSCFGGSDGSVQLIITGGTKSTDPNNPYSITSSGGTIDTKNGIISGLAKGSYIVKVTDANGCQTAQQNIEISASEKALFIASEISIPTTGFGLATGKIEISVDGGTPIDPGNGSTPTYNYVWKNNAGSTIGTNSPTLSNIAAGEYSVVITDAKGCELPKSFTVLQPTKPIVSETHLQAKCNGLTGSLDATATGGATFEQKQSEKTYTYKLKNRTTGITESIVGTKAKFENIADGEYELTATDVAGIISNTIPVTFKQPAPIVVNLIQKNVSCYNGNDGSLEAVVIGGTGPYTYIWKKETASIGSNTSKIESLSKGNYTLEIRDSNYNSNLTAYCVNVATTSISEPTDELAIESFTSTDATGYQTNNGKIEVNPSGGTPTYQYQWFFNGTVINNQSNKNLSNLAPGAYKVIITDANLICSIEKTFTINESKLLEFKVLITKVLCFGEQNGSINAIATGGVKDNNGFYTYTLFDRNKNVLESQKALEAKFDTKFAGTYYIQVTDFNLNTTPSNLNDLIPVVIEQPNKALTLVEIKKNNATCPNEADGSIIFETSGGTPNYKYTLLNVNKNTSSQVNDSAIENLLAGTYTLTVTDSNDCVQSNTFTITEPEDFGFNKEKFTLTKPILPETNWSINVVMKGGQNDYKYSIKNSSGNTLLEKVVSDKSLLINQLPTDIYTVSVTDNTGCTKTEIIDLTNNVLAASIQQTKQIICNGEGANIEALVTGGLGIKTYTWYKNNEIIPLENGTTLTNYGPGEYKFSCIDTAKLEVISNTIIITQPDVVEIKSILKTNSTCNGANDGTISINVTGGSGSYLYSLNATNWTAFSASSTAIINNLPIGDYTVYVKDSKGCNAIATALAKIEQPSILTISKINTNSTSGFGLSNGSIAVVIDGGNGNYVYKWFNENKIDINQSTSSAINLVAGKYYVEITDSKNCSITSELITISQPEKLTTLINPINQVIYCYGDKSIQLTATVAGGVPNYNFEWYDSSNFMIGTNPTSPFVGAGNYYLKVIDKNGNTATSTSVTITEPELILTSNTVVDVNCIGEENGSVTLKASGGSNTFEYRFKPENDSYGNWISFTSKNSSIQEGLKAGKYTFQIKDKNGILCSNVPNLEVSIAQPLAPISLINSKTIVTAASGFGLANGSITVEATGGNRNYTYQWFKNGSTTTIANTATANNLAAGKYFVNVTDAKGCKLTSLLIEVTEPALLITSAAVQNIILCNGDANGSLRPNTLGGFLKPGENYTYQWFADGNTTLLATSTILSGIGKGSYYVIVTDSNGNKATSKSITITEPDILKNTLSADYTLCGDANDWTITTAPTGGTTTYNYSWNTGDKTPSIQNVAPGKYSVVITDKNGCRVTNEITITAPLPLTTAAQIKKPICFEGDDATIVLTTAGGKGPYTYLWSTGAQLSQLSNAKAGTYSVTITDVKGCVIKEEYKIENPPKDLLNLGEDVTLCLDQTLTINATINDDKATYFWQSDKGFTSNKPIVTLKEPANYTLTITNKLGCKAVDTITISSQNTPISAEFAMSSQVFTNEVFTIIDISNPRPDSIEWILPAEAIVKIKNKDFAEISFAKTGEYEITMSSKKGNCTAIQAKKVLVIDGEYKDPESTDTMKNFDLKIYPNPSDGIFTVDVTLDKVMPATVKIFSLINNSIIASKSETGKQTYIFDFNLNGMIPGVYFILIESQQGSKLRKIIIQ